MFTHWKVQIIILAWCSKIPGLLLIVILGRRGEERGDKGRWWEEREGGEEGEGREGRPGKGDPCNPQLM